MIQVECTMFLSLSILVVISPLLSMAALDYDGPYNNIIIVPSNQAELCNDHSNTSCFTLFEFSESHRISTGDWSDIAIRFLPGDHFLMRSVIFQNISRLMMSSESTNISTSTTNILCQGTDSGFEFSYIRNIGITGLVFSGCGGERIINGGALFFYNVSFISITGSHFTNNRVQGRESSGGALYIVNAINVSVVSSSFVNNSAQCGPIKEICRSSVIEGGALSLIGVQQANLIYSSFEQNEATVYGGAISSVETSLVIQNVRFTSNSVGERQVFGRGGAIFTEYSVISVVDSMYCNNTAQAQGGAIDAVDSIVNISNTTFVNNTAIATARAIDKQSQNHMNDMFSSTYFTNDNHNDYGGAIYLFSCNFVDDKNLYIGNQADQGGALNIHEGNMTSEGSYFIENTGSIGGAIYGAESSIVMENDNFTNNSVGIEGGVIRIRNGTLVSSNCNYTSNRAVNGAVVVVLDTISLSINNTYFNNTASALGGVFAAYNSTIFSESCTFTANGAWKGGVFNADVSHIMGSNNNYLKNTASDNGGVTHASRCNNSEYNSHFTNNVAQGSGGVLWCSRGYVYISDSIYTDNVALFGGAVISTGTNLTIVSSTFIENRATSGGALQQLGGYILVSGSVFVGNSAINGGGILVSNASLTTSNSVYQENHAETGGAISVRLGKFATAVGCLFLNNNASFGGAVRVDNGTFSTIETNFTKNIDYLKIGGGIFVGSGNVHTTGGYYTNNIGRAISVVIGTITSIGTKFTGNYNGGISVDIGSVSSSANYFINNRAKDGGAILIKYGDLFSNHSHFINNSAILYGGAVKLDDGEFTSVESTFLNNMAEQGGGIYTGINVTVRITGDRYCHNSGQVGGAIFSLQGSIQSHSSDYTNNWSNSFGGAVFLLRGNLSINISTFSGNSALYSGGAICALSSSMYIYTDSHFTSNVAGDFGGGIYVDSCLNTLQTIVQIPVGFNGESFISRYIFACKRFESLSESKTGTVLMGEIQQATFTNNTGYSGGAIACINFKLRIGSIGNTMILRENQASHGGGMALIQSDLHIDSPVKLLVNKAVSGGAIFSYQSDINFCSNQSHDVFYMAGNTAQSGGGVHAIDSTIVITRGNLQLKNNQANRGGAIYLQQNSNINISKQRHEAVGKYDIKLEFVNNNAQYGGALMINSNNHLGCQKKSPKAVLKLAGRSPQECFIQSVLLDSLEHQQISPPYNYVNVFFANNSASIMGKAIFGGLLDRCLLSPSAELLTVYPEYENFSGVDYITTIAHFNDMVDFDNTTNTHDQGLFANTLQDKNISQFISSKPLRVCFCVGNRVDCNFNPPHVLTKRGNLFRQRVVAVDEVENPVNATVVSSFLSSNADFIIDQTRQDTTTQCTELTYNVFDRGDSRSAQIELYAEGPCHDLGISKRVISVIFLPCTCPIGFQPRETETLCSCECDSELRPYIIDCSPENETILRGGNVWINNVNSTPGSGFAVFESCPIDYCLRQPANINLNIPNGADAQCAFNRSGTLCGACRENLSFVLGSSQCQECSNSYVFLLIPFAGLGIALVAFIMLLNITVAAGTIHGVIFYANFLVASRPIFLPFDKRNVLTFIISWINLDFGIRTCFIDGMNSYGKVLLQLVFPIYILLIIVAIIIVSEYSVRFSMLIGKRDPIATLCTLILLSYSKLIRTVIILLQFGIIRYPDGSTEVVWIYDGNVPYFNLKHIPRFVIAIVIYICSVLFFVLIFFGQCIQRYGDKRFFRWANNPKYNAFITKYHAPFNSKHRYWVGLLLLVQIIHYVIAIFIEESAVLLSVICIVVFLLVIKLLIPGRIYRSWLVNTLEVSFHVNLLIFAAATYQVRETRDKEYQQFVLAMISMTIFFVTCTGILIYHIYSNILKASVLWKKFVKLCQRTVSSAHTKQENVELYHQRHLTIRDHKVNEKTTRFIGRSANAEGVNICDTYIPPPMLIHATRYDQLRDPDLDILDPVTSIDYRQLQFVPPSSSTHPSNRPKTVPTSTVLESPDMWLSTSECDETSTKK